MSQAEEQVLVIPESHFRRVGYFEGYRKSSDFTALLDPEHFSFIPRSRAESDPAFKQIIPYCVLCYEDQIFRYQRGSGGTEKRLQARYSIGIGGHINPCDGAIDADVYIAGMQRELHEEVDIGPIIANDLIGFIYDPSTPVGEVHLGVVHRISLKEPRARLRESKLLDGSFEAVSSIIEKAVDYETWSQLVLASEIALFVDRR